MEKLVRDGIPAIVLAAGTVPRFRLASKEDRLPLLFAKLREEVQELEADRSLEELADVVEVLRAIQIELDISDQQLEAERSCKEADRGGFQKGVVLLLDAV